MSRLNEIQSGVKGRIVSIDGDGRFLSRVSSIGLTIGSLIEVVSNQKKQPLLVYARDTLIAVNRRESERIAIEVTQ